MVRMEIACFFVVLALILMYFSVDRQKTRLHKVFSAYLITVLIHIFFDGVTIVTVNKMDTIPLWVNDICHRIFIGTMIVVFYFVYLYIASMIEDDINEKIHISRVTKPLLVVSLVLNFILRIEYVETDKGNYSYGPLAYMLYISICIYIALIFILLKKYWNKLDYRKKTVTFVAVLTEFMVLAVQGFYPLALISGMGIMLVTLSFYLLMENPDIMLAKQIEKEKKKAEDANAAKSVFLSKMSHEIRTPMNAIVGMTEMLLRTDLTDEQKEYLVNIKTSGNSLLSIINDILDISKIEAGKMQLVEDDYDIYNLLNDVQMIINNRIGGKNIKLFFDIADGLPRGLYGDELRIRQVLINLLNNAVKFTDEGYVSLRVMYHINDDNQAIVNFIVSDSGQGIKEEDLERLFEQFEQVNIKKNVGKEGTGLGLAISSQLVAMMGGKLQVDSVYGEGSRFYFAIEQKVVDKKNKDTVANTEYMDFVAPDAKLLIVDDSEMNLKVEKALLAPLKMNIDTAMNGMEALEKIANNQYDIVFMDNMMPVMDGLETTKRIRSMDDVRYKQLPIIAVTADAMKETEKRFMEAGVNEFLPKPIDVKRMFMLIYKWLPEGLINSDTAIEKEDECADNNTIEHIEGIDINEALKNTGSKELLTSLFKDFYNLIDVKCKKIEDCIKEGFIKDYIIEVHALKNSARMIGAIELSKMFFELECLGNANAIEALERRTPVVLEKYRSYKDVLQKYDEDVSEKKTVTNDEIISYLEDIREAMGMFDLDKADEAMKKLEQCGFTDELAGKINALKVYVTDVAMDDVINLTGEIINNIQED